MASDLASFLPSGIPPVDDAWGGLAPGGTYLLVGPASARSRLALATLDASADDGLALLVSRRPAATVVAEAAEGGQDLVAAYQAGRVRLLRAPEPSTLATLDDAGLTHVLGELADAARQARPERLVVEDFSSFLRFASFEVFSEAFNTFTEAVGAMQTTLLLGLGEPADDTSRRLLRVLQDASAGSIHVAAPEGHTLTLTLRPGTAHAGRDLGASSRPDTPGNAFVDTPLVSAADLPSPSPTADADDASRAEAPDIDDGRPTPAPLDAPLSEREPATNGHAPEDAAGPFGSSDGYGDPSDLDLTPPDLFVPPTSLDDRPEDFGEVVPDDTTETGGDDPDDESTTDWSAVTPVQPADDSFPAPYDDPFGFDLGPDLLTLGHFMDSGTHSGDGASSPLDHAATAIRESAYPDLFADPDGGTGAPALDEPPSPLTDPETIFRDGLADAFSRRGEDDYRFLVLALRLDQAHASPELFQTVAEALAGALNEESALFAAPADNRLVALLPGEGEDAPRVLFASMREHLARTPNADEALHGLGALVLPNGEPFGSADHLLTHVLQA